MNDIPSLIKTLARAAVEQDKPASVITGKVAKGNPLKIETEQKLIIEENFMIFPQRLNSHKWTEGEDVVLIRCDGGQRYLIVDLI